VAASLSALCKANLLPRCLPKCGWWLLAVGCVSVKAFSVAALVRRKELQVKFNGIIQFYAYSVPRSPQADERAVLNNKTQKRL